MSKIITMIKKISVRNTSLVACLLITAAINDANSILKVRIPIPKGDPTYDAKALESAITKLAAATIEFLENNQINTNGKIKKLVASYAQVIVHSAKYSKLDKNEQVELLAQAVCNAVGMKATPFGVGPHIFELAKELKIKESETATK